MIAPRSARRGTLPLPTRHSPPGWVPLFAALLMASCGLGCGGCGDTPPPEACAAGTFDDDADAATACVTWTACPAGEYVSAPGTATSDQTCAGCTSGTFSAGDDASSCSPWTDCVAGEYVSTVGSDSADQACMACAAGTYTSGSNQAVCVPDNGCAPGTVQTAAATPTTPAVCEACSAGQHCPGGELAATTCGGSTWDHDTDPATACVERTTCVAGTYVSAEGSATTDRTCAGCAVGTYTDTDNLSVCLEHGVCEAGTVLSEAGTDTMAPVCDVCSAGTFSTVTNAETCDAWQVCGAGLVEGIAGTTTRDRTCIQDAWTRQFGTSGDDGANSVSVGSDGSVLVAGDTRGTLPGQQSAGTEDAFVRKYDAAGNELWTRQFGTAGDDVAHSVSVGGDGSVFVAGLTFGSLPEQENAGVIDAFVRKYDAAGNELWTRQFGGESIDHAYSVSVGSDGSVLVAGMTMGTLPGQSSAGIWDAFVRKYDAAGDELWTRQFGSAGIDSAASVSVGSDGSVLVAGYTEDAFAGQQNGGGADAFVRKYDAAGNELWTRQFGTESNDKAHSVSVGSDDSVLIAGQTNGSFPGQSASGASDAFVRKYDAAGNALWTRQFGTAADDVAYSVSVGSDDSVLVAGYTEGTFPGQTSAGLYDVLVRKYDAEGNALFTQQFGSSNYDVANAVSLGSDGSMLVVGYTEGALSGQTSAGQYDVFVQNLAAP